MKKQLLLFVLFVFVGASSLLAQTKVITGTVTSAVQGEGAIPGVTVQVKGTTIGALTDVNGKYTVNVPQNATTLIFSYVGMKSQEIQISGRSTVDVVMESNVLGLSEVVVTALGISREKKALGYAVQDLGGDKLEKAKVSNIVNAFQGKLAGVQITNSDGGVASGVRILIRGVNSLAAGGNNQPLFVVDGVPINNSTTDAGAYGGRDYGNAASDLNPSDVENISVLKGGSATALYGSRAVNGVVLITTKSGKSQLGRKGLGITLEENVMFDKPLVIPKFQNLYGQGSAMDGAYGRDGAYGFAWVDGNYGGINDGVDESWGPALDYKVKAEDIQPGGKLYWTQDPLNEAGVDIPPIPQTVGQTLVLPQFDSPYDPETDVRTPTPWISHPNNIKSYFNTGIRRTTTLSVTGAKQGADFRLSLSNQAITGIFPNTDLTRNNVTFNGNIALSDKITFGGSASYISNKSNNIAENGYNGGNPMQSLAEWFGRQIDMESLRKYWNTTDPKTGMPYNWNHSYHNNPFWNMHKNTNSRDRDRLIGAVNMTWELTSWLRFKAMAGTDFYIEDLVERIAQGDVGFSIGPYGQFSSYSNRRSQINANARLEFNKSFGNFGVNAAIGSEYNHGNYQYRNTFVSKMIVPDLYTTANAAVAATTSLYESHSELQSVFGSANLSFKNYIFLDLTGRNDWSSTLPLNNNSYFYPSAALSFIVTDALGIKSNFLSFLKLRGSYAEVGGTADPYSLQGTYGSTDPFNGQASLGYTNTIPPLGLKPQRKRSKEVGMEARFFQNRLGFDVSVYKENTVNQIMNIAVSNTTGFSNKTINAGNLQNAGVEVQINATPVQTNNFSWDITVNWSANKNKVVSLYQDMKYLQLYTLSWDAYAYAFPGKDYGTIYGFALVRENAKPVYYDEAHTQLAYWTYSGRPLVSTSGRYIRSNARTPLGNIYPDWFGGVNNSFTYKNFNLSFLVDFKKGGKIFSVTHMFGMDTGVLAETATTNANGKNIRDALADGGGVLQSGVYGKVNADGTVSLTDKSGVVTTTPVENSTYMTANLWGYDFYNRRNEQSVFDASFIKLREVSAGYTFNKVGFLNKIGIRDLNLSLVGRNLWIILKHTPHIDPEISSSAGNTSVGAETNAIPSTRSLGFNVRVNF
ncbi:MAG: SusC/RagA family TonB-linked outer membrane protein [Bacteroidota bacterium]|nr:SusC/RagA family TonB-linked outer membrane protein [Bacteroidota bacterium]